MIVTISSTVADLNKTVHTTHLAQFLLFLSVQKILQASFWLSLFSRYKLQYSTSDVKWHLHFTSSSNPVEQKWIFLFYKTHYLHINLKGRAAKRQREAERKEAKEEESGQERVLPSTCSCTRCSQQSDLGQAKQGARSCILDFHRSSCKFLKNIRRKLDRK